MRQLDHSATASVNGRLPVVLVHCLQAPHRNRECMPRTNTTGETRMGACMPAKVGNSILTTVTPSDQMQEKSR
jgi:hypothetical protein